MTKEVCLGRACGRNTFFSWLHRASIPQHHSKGDLACFSRSNIRLVTRRQVFQDRSTTGVHSVVRSAATPRLCTPSAPSLIITSAASVAQRVARVPRTCATTCLTLHLVKCHERVGHLDDVSRAGTTKFREHASGKAHTRPPFEPLKASIAAERAPSSFLRTSVSWSGGTPERGPRVHRGSCLSLSGLPRTFCQLGLSATVRHACEAVSRCAGVWRQTHAAWPTSMFGNERVSRLS